MFTKGFLFPALRRLIRNRNWKFDKKRLVIPDFAFLFVAICLFPAKKRPKRRIIRVFAPLTVCVFCIPAQKTSPSADIPPFSPIYGIIFLFRFNFSICFLHFQKNCAISARHDCHFYLLFVLPAFLTPTPFLRKKAKKFVKTTQKAVLPWDLTKRSDLRIIQASRRSH